MMLSTGQQILWSQLQNENGISDAFSRQGQVALGWRDGEFCACEMGAKPPQVGAGRQAAMAVEEGVEIWMRRSRWKRMVGWRTKERLVLNGAGLCGPSYEDHPHPHPPGGQEAKADQLGTRQKYQFV
uniref:Uncharacterized protein n=1 Tax=Sphaerodactylus townsendi TaxID=933632 RepID=A0ACB8FBW9_9SAUR